MTTFDAVRGKHSHQMQPVGIPVRKIATGSHTWLPAASIETVGPKLNVAGAFQGAILIQTFGRAPELLQSIDLSCCGCALFSACRSQRLRLPLAHYELHIAPPNFPMMHFSHAELHLHRTSPKCIPVMLPYMTRPPPPKKKKNNFCHYDPIGCDLLG